MGRINGSNLKKAFWYLRRNGFKNTCYAICERLGERENYVYSSVDSETLRRQRERAEEYSARFSIVVPAYRTREPYLRAMLDSVQNQSYPKWELILADATEDDSVARVVKDYRDERVRYVRLLQNRGISENTNQALGLVRFPYTALLDHDDVLSPDALFEMAQKIAEEENRGRKVKLLYSDEDKCDGEQTRYFEPNQKEDFNLDLLLSNNYICHFLVMESCLIKELGFRKEYDGAQDFDLVLRAAERLLGDESQIAHIPKVLYHWRCHEASTAQNPRSKQYAYEAGQRAVQDFVDCQGWQARAVHLKHLGFYDLEYQAPIFQVRKDVGAVGGKLISRGRIAGGRLLEDGRLLYEGLPAAYSGRLNGACLQQDAYGVDIRLIQVRKECRELFEQAVGVPYVSLPGEETFDASTLPGDIDIPRASLAFGRAMKEAGFRILWQPSFCRKIREAGKE